jgi:hypothetical protein
VKIWQPFGVRLNRTKDLEDSGLRQGVFIGYLYRGGQVEATASVNIYRGGLRTVPASVNIYPGGRLIVPASVYRPLALVKVTCVCILACGCLGQDRCLHI